MMEKIIFGRYLPANSILHRMDPRSKLIIIFLFIAVVFLANNVPTNLLLSAFTIVTVLVSKIPINFLFNGLKFLFWIILFTFILHILFTRDGELLFQFGWFKVYEYGLRQGILISLRFTYLILITSLLTLTTSPIEITEGLEKLMSPLRKIRFPVHELALMMSIALRFIPTLMDETDKILKAQMARGVEFHGSLKKRIQAIVPLLIPLFIGAFKRADELAVAMEARGYRGGQGRTKYRQLHWGIKDSVAIVLIIGLGIALFFLRS